MKNILFVTHYLNSGGAERQMVNLACALKHRGYNVSFLCYKDGGYFYQDLLDKENIKVHWFIKGNIVNRLIKIRRTIRKGNFDVVISLLEMPNIINCISAIGGKSWKVITGESSAFRNSQKIRGRIKVLRGKVIAYLTQYSDCLICNSFNAAQIWTKFYPKYKNKICTIYNPTSDKGIAQEYFYKANGITHIIIAASFQHIKNPENLIKAVNILTPSDKKHIHIDWYGNTKAEKNIYSNSLNLINEYKLNEIICLHDVIKNIDDKMREADFVALFSIEEGLPNCICEAMMAGKPIIMSEMSDYNVLCNNNGYLCKWDDINSIADALCKAINTGKEQLTIMGKVSRKRAEELFNTDKIIQQWIDIIEK